MAYMMLVRGRHQQFISKSLLRCLPCTNKYKLNRKRTEHIIIALMPHIKHNQPPITQSLYSFLVTIRFPMEILLHRVCVGMAFLFFKVYLVHDNLPGLERLIISGWEDIMESLDLKSQRSRPEIMVITPKYCYRAPPTPKHSVSQQTIPYSNP